MTDPCRFGPHCRTRRAGRPGDAELHGLCWPCEQHGRHAISQLPHQWYALGGIIGRDTGRGGITGATTTAEAPIPLREHIDALQREIVYVLATWEEPVRDVAHLSDVATCGVRDATVVRRAARVLTNHYPTLLGLPPTTVRRYTSDELVWMPGELYAATYVDELDGPAAVTVLADLYRRADRTLGNVRAWEPRSAPCPPDRYGGCGLAELPAEDGSIRTALVWEIGSDFVQCRNCGWTIDVDRYRWYAETLIPPAARPAYRPAPAYQGAA